jgi:hypothetical protein
MNAREPMACRRREPPILRRDDGVPRELARGVSGNHWIRVVLIVVACWGAWTVAAGAWRQQHCILLFGHWLTVDHIHNPWFCQ